MADHQDYTNLAGSLALGDFLIIRDVSDTTDPVAGSANGATKEAAVGFLALVATAVRASADSPITAALGELVRLNADGAITVNSPGTSNLYEGHIFGVQIVAGDPSANTVTLARNGFSTINGASDDATLDVLGTYVFRRQGTDLFAEAVPPIILDSSDQIANDSGVTGATVSDALDTLNSGKAAASHNHAASAITSGTLAHERGGLEADVSAYDGVVRISGGATSALALGISNDAVLQAKNTPASGEFARFTTTGIEGLTEAEFKAAANLEIGTDVQAADADLTTLASAFTSAAASGPASLDLHEDTDNGSHRVRLIAPAALGGDRTATFQDADGTVAYTGDLHSAVTLAGSLDYLTLSGQQITRGAIDLATDTTGTLATAGIADNAVSDGKLRDSAALSVIGRGANSTGDPADISASAASGAVLRESGSALGFGTVATAGIADDAVTDGKIRNSAALSVIGRSANSTGDPADIAAGADGDVLRRSGTTLGFGSIVQSAVTNLVSDLAAKLALAGGTVTGEIALGSGGSINDAGPITASGSLTRATHGGRVVKTSGNITIPNASGDVGMGGMIIGGGAHTVAFNSTTSAALAAGDIVSYYVESTTVIHAVKVLAANKMTFT